MNGNTNRKYFILNQKSDFERGFLQDMALEDGRLRMTNEVGTPGCMLSRVFDSKEKDMQWHRFKLNCSEESPSGRMVVYTSETPFLVMEEESVSIEECIRNPKMTLGEKLSAMEPYRKKEYPYFEDVFLHDIRGRYLWFLLELYPQEEHIELWNFTLFFPGRTWMETLPEIYQQSDKNGFLERYLGLFQTMYEDLEERIAHVPGLLDVDRADSEFLGWMAEWLDIEERYRWSSEQLRTLIKKAFLLYRKRGTREGILEFVELYTGEKPVLVEWGQYKDIQHNEKLYPDDPYTVMVFVRAETLRSEKERRTLVRIIEDVMPAHMTLELVVMNPYIFLDNHTYLGINSCLGKYKKGQLDGKLALSFSTMN
ncbi:MAG: hypothetical protein IJ679_09755 [Lachnospiraceae bacterium]|nr:hypothetical protein [Lachnospiraceae bacterium]